MALGRSWEQEVVGKLICVVNSWSFAEGVLKRKFMGPRHREAKQTQTLEFEAEKGIWQGSARRESGLCPQNLNSLNSSVKYF